MFSSPFLLFCTVICALQAHLAIAQGSQQDLSWEGGSRSNQIDDNSGSRGFNNNGNTLTSSRNGFSNDDENDFDDDEDSQQVSEGSGQGGSRSQQTSNWNSGSRTSGNSRAGGNNEGATQGTGSSNNGFQQSSNWNGGFVNNENSRFGGSNGQTTQGTGNSNGSGNSGSGSGGRSRVPVPGAASSPRTGNSNGSGNSGTGQGGRGRVGQPAAPSEQSPDKLCSRNRIKTYISTGNNTINFGDETAAAMIWNLTVQGKGPCVNPPSCDNSPAQGLSTQIVDAKDHTLVKPDTVNITVTSSNFGDKTTMMALIFAIQQTLNHTNQPQNITHQDKKHQKHRNLGWIWQNYNTDEVMVSRMDGEVDCGSMHVKFNVGELDLPNPEDLLYCEILKASIDLIFSAISIAAFSVFPAGWPWELGIDFFGMSIPVPCPGGGFLRKRELLGLPGLGRF